MNTESAESPSRAGLRVIGRLLVCLTLSHVRVERLKSVLTLFGLSLGIALFMAIRLANESAWQSFTDSVDRVAPTTPLRLVGDGGGVPERLIPQILNLSGVLGVSPLVTTYVPARKGEQTLGTVQVLGIDPFAYRGWSKENTATLDRSAYLDLLRKPTGALVSTALRAQSGFELLFGSRSIAIEPLGTLPEDGLGASFGGKVVVMDIAHLQDLTRRYHEVDALDIALAQKVEPKAVTAKLTPLLPHGVHLAEPGENERYGETMTQAFRLNLNFLAGLSLVVALLLTYNSASYSVLKRRREFGILLAIGGSVRSLQRVVFVEALVFGVLSSLLGIAIGRVLAAAAAGQVTGTLNTLYLPVAPIPLAISTRVLIEGMLLGPVLSVIGYLTPLREIATVPPYTTFGYQTYEAAFRGSTPRLAIFGIAALVVAGLTAQPGLLGYHPYLGLVSPSALMLATLCLMPGVLQWLLLTLQRRVGRYLPLETPLAIDHIMMTIRRSSVAVSAMAVAIGMYLGVSTLIVSFRGTVATWIDHVTKADVYISPPMNIGSTLSGALPPELIALLRSEPSVQDLDTIAARRVVVNGHPIRLNGVHVPYIDQYDRLLFIEREAKDAPPSGLPRVYLSESASHRLGLKLGDRLTLPGTVSSPEVVVGAIYYDFSSDQGVVLLPDSLFEAMYGTEEKQGLSLYFRPGGSAEHIRELIAARLPTAQLFVRDNRSLRAEVLKIFDKTFLITYALQAIALAISGVTLLNTLLMLVLEREREFAVLRAIGASRRALTKLVVSESVLLGIAAVLGGVALGAGLALQLVFVINRFYFGWSVDFAFPLGPLVTTCLGAVGLAAVVGLWPGLRIARHVDGSMLRYE